MDKSSKKTSAFGLSGEKIAHLLSIGREEDLSGVVREGRHSAELQIEGYEIAGKVAEAGQGQVWRALQQSTGREVAIKVPRLGSVASERARIRFEREVELAAKLKHPNIARIYDSGVDRGQYYYVMDFVEGSNLDDYVRKHDLANRQILELMRTLCQAVQHAHQNGIIHRDLKPSNIIVTDDGRPFIVDFGLAKAILLEDEQGPTISMDGETVGTPAYMSPEQAAGRVDEVDTRTDIYSLGVILFNLLTGESPHDLSGSRQQVLSRISDGQVKRPRTVCRSIDRDLETLLLKTLDRDPNRRYSSASSLADDIENYLDGAPLMAGPPSTIYRLMKYVRRNAALSSAVLAAVVILFVGLITTTAMYIQADRARADKQAAYDLLLNSVLASLDPFKVGGKEITIRSVWDAAAERLEGEFQGTPLAEAEIHYTIGSGYWSLGLYKLAESHLKSALDIQQAQLGIEHPATLASMHQLGWVYFAQSRFEEAEQLLLQARQTRGRLLGDKHPDTLYSIMGLACVYNVQGRFQEAEQLAEEALETTRRALGPEHWYVPGFMNILAWNYTLQGRYENAERQAKEGLGIARRKLGENHWFTLYLQGTFGRACEHLGHYNEAERHFVDALDHWRDTWEPNHPDTLAAMNSLGCLYYTQGRYEQAEKLLIEALETSRRVLGDIHHISMDSMYWLGCLYLSQRQYDEAESLLEEALKIANDIAGEKNWYALRVMNTQAKLYIAQSRYDDAERLFRETLKARTSKLGDEHPDTLETINDFGVLRREQERYDESESLLRKVLEGRQSKLGNDHPACFESMHELAVLYKQQKRYEEAEKLLLEALKGRRLKLGDEHPHTIDSMNNLIDLYKAWNKPEQAEQWREKLPREQVTEE